MDKKTLMEDLARTSNAKGGFNGAWLYAENGEVVSRMKFVRQTFLQNVATSETHWLNRPIVPNLLRYPVEAIYEVQLPKEALG